VKVRELDISIFFSQSGAVNQGWSFLKANHAKSKVYVVDFLRMDFPKQVTVRAAKVDQIKKASPNQASCT
jgi:hypothetical protein